VFVVHRTVNAQPSEVFDGEVVPEPTDRGADDRHPRRVATGAVG
jgi:hypothetical protein